MEVLWFLLGVLVGAFAVTSYVEFRLTPVLREMMNEVEDVG